MSSLSLMIRLCLASGLSLVTLDAASGAALAETSTEDNRLENIVVTARRTEEQLQTTPVAVTAFTADSLERMQIHDMDALQYNVPSLSVTADGVGTLVTLRGQAQTASQQSVDSTVGLYVDGVYYARSQTYLADLEDIKRVEVLRGPQGTLFGRNTTGGAVNIVTNEPTDEFGGQVRIGAGNYNSWDAAGVLNSPIVTDAVSARLVVKHAERSGFGRNTFLNKDVNDNDLNYYRGSLKIAPKDAMWNLILVGDYMHQEGHGAGMMVHLLDYNRQTFGNNFAPFEDAIAAPFYETRGNRGSSNHMSSYGGSATLTAELYSVTLKSITSVRGYKSFTRTDYDSSTFDYFNADVTHKQHQFSQELQLSGRLIDTIEWIAGGFYFEERADELFDIFDGGVLLPDHGKHESIAAYAQANYNITDALRLTTGLRWTIDNRRERLRNMAFGGCSIVGAVPPECRAVDARRFDYPSYALGLDYKLSPEIMVYAKTGMAHRSGGINTQAPALVPYGPEKLTDYEIGVKSDWYDHRLRLNAAAYYSDYRNMQRTILRSAGTGTGVAGSFTQSVGKARIPGIEIEATVVPLNKLELTASLGKLWPRYIKFSDETGDLSSQPFLFVAKLNYGLGASYTIPASYGSYSLHADWGYQSHKWFSPSYSQEGYGLLNAQASLDLDASSMPPLTFTLWGKNLAGKQYNAFVLDTFAASGFATAQRGTPRTFGGNITYRF